MNDNLENISELTKNLLLELGEDPNREGLVNTPLRVSKAWRFFSQGYKKKIRTIQSP